MHAIIIIINKFFNTWRRGNKRRFLAITLPLFFFYCLNLGLCLNSFFFKGLNLSPEFLKFILLPAPVKSSLLAGSFWKDGCWNGRCWGVGLLKNGNWSSLPLPVGLWYCWLFPLFPLFPLPLLPWNDCDLPSLCCCCS